MRKIKNLLLKNAGCQILQVRLGLGMHVVRSCRLGLGFYRVVESSLIALESFIFSNRFNHDKISQQFLRALPKHDGMMLNNVMREAVRNYLGLPSFILEALQMEISLSEETRW